MPNDAKLGLVVGMILVLLIALLFFRKEGTSELPAAPVAPAKLQAPPSVPPPSVPPPAPPKHVAPEIEPPPRGAPSTLPEELPELPPPAFEPPAAPPPSSSKITHRQPRVATAGSVVVLGRQASRWLRDP
jgi:hypothetical protein